MICLSLSCMICKREHRDHNLSRVGVLNRFNLIPNRFIILNRIHTISLYLFYKRTFYYIEVKECPNLI